MPLSGPVRVLALTGLVRAVAFGFLLTVSVLYGTQFIGLSAQQAGLSMTVAAACGALGGIPAGRAADAFGARGTAVVLGVAQGCAGLFFVLADTFAGFVLAASLAVGCQSASEAVRGALVASLVEGEGRVRARAFLHAVANAGMSLGAVGGGVALESHSRTVLLAAFGTCGLLFALAGAGCARLPPTPAVPRPARLPASGMLKDAPFVLFTVLNVLLVMNDGLLTVVLPLWIAERTDAPLGVYSAILVLNTACVVLFQVRASRGTARLAGGVRALRRSGLLLAACCVLFLAASGRPAGWAVVLLLAGALVHAVGELVYSAGSWSMAFALAPDHAQGQYQGVFTTSIHLGGMVAPVLGTALILGVNEQVGWLVFALLFATAGLLAPVVSRLAARGAVSAPSPL
ncbi:MFS transporter [Streptomyces sp. NPDC088789]|uniref:MFS transporter n=1 Tax=Streptomyces sp. NPDC088789 TaxID=3365899 RepID=UPI0038088734